VQGRTHRLCFTQCQTQWRPTTCLWRCFDTLRGLAGCRGTQEEGADPWQEEGGWADDDQLQNSPRTTTANNCNIFICDDECLNPCSLILGDLWAAHWTGHTTLVVSPQSPQLAISRALQSAVVIWLKPTLVMHLCHITCLMLYSPPINYSYVLWGTRATLTTSALILWAVVVWLACNSCCIGLNNAAYYCVNQRFNSIQNHQWSFPLWQAVKCPNNFTTSRMFWSGWFDLWNCKRLKRIQNSQYYFSSISIHWKFTILNEHVPVSTDYTKLTSIPKRGWRNKWVANSKIYEKLWKFGIPFVSFEYYHAQKFSALCLVNLTLYTQNQKAETYHCFTLLTCWCSTWISGGSQVQGTCMRSSIFGHNEVAILLAWVQWSFQYKICDDPWRKNKNHWKKFQSWILNPLMRKTDFLWVSRGYGLLVVKFIESWGTSLNLEFFQRFILVKEKNYLTFQ